MQMYPSKAAKREGDGEQAQGASCVGHIGELRNRLGNDTGRESNGGRERGEGERERETVFKRFLYLPPPETNPQPC